MQNFNYHTHTFRCGHARGTDEEYVKAAIKAGYASIGFSDHAPYQGVPAPRVRMPWEMLEDYISSIKALKEKYRGVIDIHLGLETEFVYERIEEKKQLRQMTDYLILGQHFSHADGKGSVFRFCSDEQIMDYAEHVCRALDSGLFLYVAHPDVFMCRQTEFNETCARAAVMIVEKAVETNTPLEINLEGASLGKHDFPSGSSYYYPHREFWKIASQYPVRCLFGLDAHYPDRYLETGFMDLVRREFADLNLNFIKEPLL